MLLKLALRNVRRLIRDYAIYFITLLFGVVVFYAFNSIGSQQILFDLNESSSTIFQSTQIFMQLFSCVVAFVLAFLIIYANQMLIRRRKHEFGMYLMLGMSPGRVSRIILYETVIVGFASLVLGLVCGVGLSQLLSFATAAMFAIPMKQYQFVFSNEAFMWTLISFVAIYVIVAIFNVITINRCQLIDLLSAENKTQKLVVRNPWICFGLFIVSIGIIAASYATLDKSGVIPTSPDFWLATVLMLVGTLILFWSLSGFFIAIITHAKGIYLRGLVPFTVRQIASRVNTAFVSLWAVCVLLFFAITTFSAGMTMVSLFTDDLERANPYDMSISAGMFSRTDLELQEGPNVEAYAQQAQTARETQGVWIERGDAYDWNMQACLRDLIPQWDSLVAGSAQMNIWKIPGTTYGDLLQDSSSTTGSEMTDNTLKNANLEAVMLSDYNAAMSLQGKEGLSLADDEIALGNNMDVSEPFAKDILAKNNSVNLLGQTYALKDSIVSFQLQNEAMSDNALTFVVPDTVINQLKEAGALPQRMYLNVNLYEPVDDCEKALEAEINKAFPAPDPTSSIAFQGNPWPLSDYITRTEMYEQAQGFRMMITYLALYIGFVLLISTAAILAIQQLSQTTDSIGRYQLLSKLGCDTRMINRSLFAQTLIYFLAPLVPAMCHCVRAMEALSSDIFMYLNINLSSSIMMTALLVLVVYGAYLLITYLSNRTMIRQSLLQGK